MQDLQWKLASILSVRLCCLQCMLVESLHQNVMSQTFDSSPVISHEYMEHKNVRKWAGILEVGGELGINLQIVVRDKSC